MTYCTLPYFIKYGTLNAVTCRSAAFERCCMAAQSLCPLITSHHHLSLPRLEAGKEEENNMMTSDYTTLECDQLDQRAESNKLSDRAQMGYLLWFDARLLFDSFCFGTLNAGGKGSSTLIRQGGIYISQGNFYRTRSSISRYNCPSLTDSLTRWQVEPSGGNWGLFWFLISRCFDVVGCMTKQLARKQAQAVA